MKADSNKNRSMNIESYNNQLIRHISFFSKLMATFILNQDKADDLLNAAPKEFTLNQIINKAYTLTNHIDNIAN